jgi:hypothetical protein
MSVFGWHYPPGAANDPNAPWNRDDDWTEGFCPTCLETYPKEWLDLLLAGLEPPSPYPLCGEKCNDAEEAADPLEWD